MIPLENRIWNPFIDPFSKQSIGIIAPMKGFEGDELRGLTFNTEKSFIIMIEHDEVYKR